MNEFIDPKTSHNAPSLCECDNYNCHRCYACFCPCFVFTSIHKKANKININKYKLNKTSDCCRCLKCCILPSCCYYLPKRTKLMKRFNYVNYNSIFCDNILGSCLLTIIGCYSCMLIQEKKIIDNIYGNENYNDYNDNTDDDFWFWCCISDSSNDNLNNSSSSDCCKSDCCDGLKCDCDCDDD